VGEHSIKRLERLGCRPNPFNPSTEIFFELNAVEFVLLSIYDVHGQHVRALMEGILGIGEHRVRWDGRSDDGLPLSSGVYFAQVKIGALRGTAKLVLVR